MAFVYRSQKSSFFQNKKSQAITTPSPSLNNQQSQLNGTSYDTSPKRNSYPSPTKIVKGLPSLLGRQKNHQYQQSQNIQPFEKESQFLQQLKSPSIKINTQKLKKTTENYIFSSKVVRDTDIVPFKQLKNLKCNQFDSNKKEYQIKDQQKRQNLIKQTTLTNIVNKNLFSTASQTNFDFRKSSKIFNKNQKELQKIIVSCSKDQAGEIRRKSSPPPRQSNKSHNYLSNKNSNQTTFLDDKKLENIQSKIYMKTFSQAQNFPFKKNITQKKISCLKKGNLQSSFYKQVAASSDSQSEIEESPGPGAYQNIINPKQKKSFRSKKSKFAKIFVSPLERFKTQQVKYHEVTFVNDERTQRLLKIQMFLSRTPKFKELQKKSHSPPPGTYNVRQSIQHDIVRNLLKNANVPNFSSSMPRFNYQRAQVYPGPGDYDVDSIEKLRLQQLRNHMSSSYKSLVKRSLVNQMPDSIKEDNKVIEMQVMGDKQLQKIVIHKRQQHFKSSQFFTAPAFLSGVERFNQQFQFNDSGQGVLLKNSTIKQVKNCQPFNSSSKRNMAQKVGQGVGVGSYIVQKDQWNKKSYNVYFH